MKIAHVALWTSDLEVSRRFYTVHFCATAGARYENPAKGFASYFLTFADGAHLEIMHKTAITRRAAGDVLGLAHFALSVGSEDAVRALTDQLRAAGVPVVSEPRRTGDGYYESVIADPDGNLIEITV